MKSTRRALIGFTTALALAACATAQTASTPQPAQRARFVIATPEQAAPIFTANDEFMSVVTPADISIRTRSATGTREDLVRTYAGAFEPWTDAERARLDAMLVRRAAQLESISRWLPDTVLLVKSNGAADTALPHTRGNAINMGQALNASDDEVDGLFFHELFHVLSRHNAARHNEMYALIGFQPCSIDLPEAVRAQTVTNPDAPALRWAVPTDAVGGYMVPVLFADPPRWDPARPDFGGYFNLRFLRASDAGGRCALTLQGGQPVDMPQADAIAAIHEQAGANTNYVLHAEELLADNFAQLMTGDTVPNPEVHARLAAFLGIPVG